MINNMSRLGGVGVGGRNPVRIMGILNASPESFYKGSVRTTRAAVRDSVREMEDAGADFVDVGGMSTAPYLNTMVPERTESERIVDAIKVIRDVSNLPISVDTCRASVAAAALEHGARIVNDISGLKHDPEMRRVVSRLGPSLVLCAHSPRTVSGSVASTGRLLDESVGIAAECGVSRHRIALDPAIGFFRRDGRGPFFTRIGSDWARRDARIIRDLDSIRRQGLPVLVSVSNKSFIGELLGGRSAPDRLYGSLAAEVVSVLNGADIVRTHNVRASRDAIRVALQIRHKGL